MSATATTRYIFVSEVLEVIKSHTGKEVSTSTVHRWIEQGKLRSIRLGHRHLVSEADLKRVLGTPNAAD